MKVDWGSFNWMAIASCVVIGQVFLTVWFVALVASCFALATALPGYAFLKRYRAFSLAWGSQAVLTLILASVLAVWR